MWGNPVTATRSRNRCNASTLHADQEPPPLFSQSRSHEEGTLFCHRGVFGASRPAAVYRTIALESFRDSRGGAFQAPHARAPVDTRAHLVGSADTQGTREHGRPAIARWPRGQQLRRMRCSKAAFQKRAASGNTPSRPHAPERLLPGPANRDSARGGDGIDDEVCERHRSLGTTVRRSHRRSMIDAPPPPSLLCDCCWTTTVCHCQM